MLKIMMGLPRLLGPLGWGLAGAIMLLAAAYAWCVYCIIGSCY
jgi:hypothetical protein